MRSAARVLAASVFATGLVGCGGGGGGGGGATPPASVPLQQALANLYDSGYQKTYSLTGTATYQGQTLNLAGSLQVTDSGHKTAASFNGAPALSSTTTMAGTFDLLGQSIPISTSTQSFINGSYVPLGTQSPTSYCVVTSYTPVPVSASVGTAGTYSKSNCYADSTKRVLLGTETVSYSLSAGTSSSNLTLTEVDVFVDTANVTQSTAQMKGLIDTSGSIQVISQAGAATFSGVFISFTAQ